MSAEMSRRTFVGLIGGAMAANCLPALSADRMDSEGEASSSKTDQLLVDWEWGALRETVVGCPWARIPTSGYKFWGNYTSNASRERLQSRRDQMPPFHPSI